MSSLFKNGGSANSKEGNVGFLVLGSCFSEREYVSSSLLTGLISSYPLVCLLTDIVEYEFFE